MSKLSDELVKALSDMGDYYGFCGWPDEAEAVIEGIKALEAQLAQVTAERDNLKAIVDGALNEAAAALMERTGESIAAKARREALQEAQRVAVDAYWAGTSITDAIQTLIDSEGGDT